MTVRFKSEYQKSFGASGARRVSPQHRHLLAGLRSDHMGTSEEPALQHRRTLGPVAPARSCSPTVPPAVHRKEPNPKVNAQTGPGSPAEPDAPAGPGPPSDPEPAGGPEGASKGLEPAAEGGSAKPRPSRPGSQSQPSRPVTAAGDGEVDSALKWKAGLRSKGQRSGGHRSEYRRQFSWKTPAATESPILSAHQVVYSCSRSVPPFKKNPVSQVTEYQRSFLGLAPPTGPRLRRHLQQQRTPLFHTQLRGLKKRREESRRRPRPQRGTPHKKDIGSPEKATPPPSPPQVHRDPGGGRASEGHAQQVKELRQQAQSYRHRSWGTNFSRDHLSQLLSEHNVLWEPADSSATPTPRPTLPLPASPGQHRRSSSYVEALDLHSQSSTRSTVEDSGGRRSKPAGPPAGTRTAWEGGGGVEGGEGEGSSSSTEEEEGRLPTPRLKTKPVQRTHHDLTTPATGGAILVGKLRSVDDHHHDRHSSCAQKCESAVSMAAGAEPLVKQKEAWLQKDPASPSSPLFPKHKPAPSTPSKPIRTKHTPPPVEAPPLLHGIQGTLRNADFQHNGKLGLRLREPPCSRDGCDSDEDDRLSVMSWRSAASCSAASAVLERALKRREDFWGKT